MDCLHSFEDNQKMVWIVLNHTLWDKTSRIVAAKGTADSWLVIPTLEINSTWISAFVLYAWNLLKKTNGVEKK